jgi:peptide subunit release factor 1 (eRF1)
MKCTKISLYVPPKRPRQDILNQIVKERNIALNIKDEETRLAVTDGLAGIIDFLNSERMSKNGFIVFAEGREIKVITPVNDKVGANAYRCDDHYYEPHRRIEGLVP